MVTVKLLFSAELFSFLFFSPTLILVIIIAFIVAQLNDEHVRVRLACVAGA